MGIVLVDGFVTFFIHSSIAGDVAIFVGLLLMGTVLKQDLCAAESSRMMVFGSMMGDEYLSHYQT